ncbi:MAG: ROK family transcriptional regulator [Lachnospiraceae bacterium]|nr:ROK family transcriptional regulator [Lachnospiraceae bacterium]
MLHITGSNSARAKTSNHTAILRLICQHGPVKRADLKDMLDLTLPTITTSVNAMIRAGLVRETAPDETGAPGRKAHALTIDPAYGHFLGIEMRDTGRTACITDFRGRMLYAAADTKLCTDYDRALRSAASLYRKLLKQSGLDAASVKGVGLAVPGLVDSAKGVLTMHPRDNWLDKSICADFRSLTAFRGPVRTMNNTASRAIAAQLFRQDLLHDADLFAYLLIADGIACPLVVNAPVMSESVIGNGEVGHMVMHENGALCSCGNRGCLEAYAGDRAILSVCTEAMQSGKAPGLKAVLGKKDAPSMEEILLAQEKGDPFVTGEVQQALTTLGIAIANIANLSNMDTLLIEGKLFDRAENQKLLTGTISKHLYSMVHSKTTFRFLKADPLSGALGGAAVAILNAIERYTG